MEFRIAKSNKARTLYLTITNLGITLTIATVIFYFGQIHNEIHYIDLIFEAASGVVAFAAFIVAAQVKVSGARMNWLLLGLFFFQLGAMIDVLGEIVTFNGPGWSIAGGALHLTGELTLATVALLFVRLTNRIASTDRLTSLYNKAFHNRWIEDYLDRSNKAVAVIAIDLDRFKAINDLHGHAVGDTVLRHIGESLNTYIQDHRGIASRTGGEEFEVALKDSNEQAALAMAEQLRALIELNPPIGIETVTASIGVALSKQNESVTALRKRADAAAYFSKQSGRNCVSLAGENQTLARMTIE